MSNRSVWNVQRRHEWLSKPIRGKRLNRRKRLRIGLEQALARKNQSAQAGAGDESTAE